MKKTFLIIAVLSIGVMAACKKKDQAPTPVAPNPMVNPSPTATPPQIAFASWRDGTLNIYMMNPDGSAQTQLTDSSTNDHFPSWSPDRGKIAFTSNRLGDWEIFTMNADGTNPLRLTNNLSQDTQPKWSPDGTKIMFLRGGLGNGDIYTINIDGSNETLIFSGGTDAAWSPDGTKIVFVKSSDSELYVMNADGTSPTQISFFHGNITCWTNFPRYPAWSPDGSKIAFTDTYHVSPTDFERIWVMNPDGSNCQKLTHNDPFSDTAPAWSPDGSQISFHTNRDNDWEIYVMDADGQNSTRKTFAPNTDSFAAWANP